MRQKTIGDFEPQYLTASAAHSQVIVERFADDGFHLDATHAFDDFEIFEAGNALVLNRAHIRGNVADFIATRVVAFNGEKFDESLFSTRRIFDKR